MNLQLHILSALRDVMPHAMTDEVLLAQVRMAKPGGADMADVRGELVDLEQKGQVRRWADEDRGALYEILTAGRARLNKMNL